MSKKIVILLGIIILLSVGAGLLLLYGKNNSNKNAVEQVQPEIKKLIDDEAISPIPSYDGSAIWYFTSKTKLFRINTDGSGLSEFPLPALATGNLKLTFWPSTGNDFIAVTSDSLGEMKNYYDSAQKKYVTLPLNIQSFDWLPDGKRIAYVWKSGDNIHQQLVIANADGTGYRAVKDVFWPDLMVKVSPLGKESLLIRSKPEGDANKIYLANMETGGIETVVDQGKNLGALWLPGGEKFIFAQDSITGVPRLFLYNFSSKQVVDLNLSTALDKVVIDKDGKYLYAAQAKKDNTGDEFVKLDLATFKLEPYFDPGQDIRAKNLNLANSTIYFINTRDNKIYYINK